MSAGHAHPATLAGDTASPIHRLDPRAKLLGLVAVILVAVSAPLADWPVWVACAAALAGVAALARVPAALVWRRARVVLPPVLLVAAVVPFAAGGRELAAIGPLGVSAHGVEVLVSVAAKATIGTTAIVILGATTTFPSVITALEGLRTPRLLTLTAAFMYRYFFTIAGEVRRMRLGLAARAYRPRTLLHAAPIGRLVAALFLRSYGRGERVYLAMLSRGWSGRMPRIAPLRWSPADSAFLAGLLVALVPLRVALEVLP